MDCYIHQSPGRIRFRLPLLRDNDVATRVQKRLHGIHGINFVKVGTATGSVTIYYRESETSATTLFRHMRRLVELPNVIIMPQAKVTKQPAPNPLASLLATPLAEELLISSAKLLLRKLLKI